MPKHFITAGFSFYNIYILLHPSRTNTRNKGNDNYQTRRSSIQVAELEYVDGQIVYDRDKPVFISLKAPKNK